MDVSESQRALPLHPNGRDNLAPPNDNLSEHGQYVGSIKAQCFNFMQRVNQFLGDKSPEWITLHQALGEFQKGRLSKREAYHTMMDIVGDNEELKQGLLDVLSHEQASWGPGDFDQESVDRSPVNETATSPAFLQPQHQPEMRMPSASTSFNSEESAMNAINPVLFQPSMAQYTQDRSTMSHHHTNGDMGGYEQHDRTSYGTQDVYKEPEHFYQAFDQNQHSSWNGCTTNENLSSAHLLPTEMVHAQSYSSPSLGFALPIPYTSSAYGPEYSSPGVGDSGQRRHSMYLFDGDIPSGSVHRYWPNAEFYHSHEGLPSHNTQQYIPTSHVLHQVRTPSLASSLQTSPYEPPSMWTPPTPAPVEQSKHEEMAPPPTKRNSESHKQPVTLGPVLPSSKDGQAPIRQPKTRTPAGTGKFIHGLCGKGFHSRSAVKKHHWGHAKAGDTSTKTGCWAKHSKPNREWDEHSSCKPDIAASRAAASMRLGSKAPVVPTMIANPNQIIPGFPTLSDLPNTVAEVVNSVPVFNEPPFLYNSSRLPVRSSFDSLLTAVNAIAEVDAPQPHGRNDSVVSYLDAQVAAAEHNGRNLGASQPMEIDGGYAPVSRKQMPAIGLGITHDMNMDQSVSNAVQDAPPLQQVIPAATSVGPGLAQTDQSSSSRQGQAKAGKTRSHRTLARRIKPRA